MKILISNTIFHLDRINVLNAEEVERLIPLRLSGLCESQLLAFSREVSQNVKIYAQLKVAYLLMEKLDL